MGKWFRRLAQGVAGILGGSIAGPLGALITVALFELLWPDDDGGLGGLKGGLPPHLQQQLEVWIDRTGERITYRLFATELNNKTKQDLVGDYCVGRVNWALKELATLKAYVQFQNMHVTPGSDTDKLNKAKLHGLDYVINAIVQVYTEATQGVVSVFNYGQQNFKASDIDKIEAELLNWQGQSVTAKTTGYFRTGTLTAEGPTRVITTKGGDTQTGGETQKGGAVNTGTSTGTTAGSTTTGTSTSTTTGTTTTTKEKEEYNKGVKSRGIIVIGGVLAGLLLSQTVFKTKKKKR